MRFSTLTLGVLLASAATAPAFAQEATDPPPAVKISGGATLISDYRFRGLTQSDEEPAVQGTVNVNTAIGFYAGVWASTIDGDGTTPALTGYGDAEVDLYGGYTTSVAGFGVDVGVLYYYYPDAVSGLDTDFFEPYASASYTLGPVSTKVGATYAWGGQDGLDFTSGKDDNLYVFGDASIGVPTTPITVNGHVGYSNGSLGLVNPTSDDTYLDWSVGAEWTGGPLVGGLKYIDTDITSARIPGVGRFDQTLGRGSTVVGYVGVKF